MTQSNQIILTLDNVRISYFYGFRPYIGRSDSGKETKSYTCHAIIPPNHPALAKVKAAMRAAAVAGWQNEADAVLVQLAATDKLCLHKGDITKPGEEAYKGNFYVSANSKVRPAILTTRGGVNVSIEEDDPQAPYSGCLANVMVAIYAQSPNGKPSQWGKRLPAQLMGVQFVAHGEKFGGGGRIAKPEEFGVVAGEADSAAPAGAAAGPGSDLL